LEVQSSYTLEYRRGEQRRGRFHLRRGRRIDARSAAAYYGRDGGVRRGGTTARAAPLPTTQPAPPLRTLTCSPPCSRPLCCRPRMARPVRLPPPGQGTGIAMSAARTTTRSARSSAFAATLPSPPSLAASPPQPAALPAQACPAPTARRRASGGRATGPAPRARCV